VKLILFLFASLLLLAAGEDPGGTQGLGNGEPWHKIEKQPEPQDTVLHLDTILGTGIADRIECCGSMVPYITEHDLVLGVDHQPGVRYTIGDVISFEQSNCSATHRIISVRSNGYITSGDNRPYTDRCIVGFENVTYKIIGVVKDVYKETP
jgi:hypothetical protein